MIESEEKRKIIIDMLNRWAAHCKIDHLLRDGDILGLADSIIERFYRIRLCCCHYVDNYEDSVDLEMNEYDDEGNLGTSFGVYCKDCAEWFLKNDKSCKIVKRTHEERD